MKKILITGHFRTEKVEIIGGLREATRHGTVSINHSNLYVMLLDLVLGRYGVPYAKVNGTE